MPARFMLLPTALCLCACGSAMTTDESPAPSPSAFDELVATFSEDYAALDLPDLELSFVTNLKNLGSKTGLQRQRDAFARYRSALAGVDPQSLDTCRRIELSVMQLESELGHRRAELGLDFLAADVDPDEISSLGELEHGDAWYAWLLARWNGAVLQPDAVFAFGEKQLTAAVGAWDALHATMLPMDAADTARVDGGAPTLKVFKARQNAVWANLETLFLQPYGVEPATIARFDRGASFPVPGYYDIDQQTFYYNVLEADYEARQADWLFLHEATPGHHFQVWGSRQQSRCKRRLPEIFYSGYSEGWAAYTETLGEELGLYRTAPAKLASIEWDMVRSVRVVLDVALNVYGWSDEKALAYWHEHVRGMRHVAEREIARMRRWPAQVITYKYGASVFGRLRAQYTSGPAAVDVRVFHDAAIAWGSMPLATFEQLLPDLMAAAE